MPLSDPGHADARPAGAGDAREPPRWRVLADDGLRDPAENLARDEALARTEPVTPTVRLWRSSPSVVVGRAQVTTAEVDLAACRRLGIPVLRRFTGGGTVYHDPGNLNVTIVLERQDERLRARVHDGLAGVYGLVLEPLAAAIHSLGSEVTGDGRGLWIGGRKVSGAAAWLGARAILVHATLLVDADLETLELVLAGPGEPGNSRWEHTRSRRAAVTSLAREGLTSEAPVIDRAVVAAFAEDAADLQPPAGFAAEESAAAARLLADRYQWPDWHMEGRSRDSA
jgi:lipoate-protein ligase A